MTKAETEFQRKVRELGCIVCLEHFKLWSPAEIHHRLSAGRRVGEMDVLGLCFQHHRAGRDDADCVSRDHSLRRFEARYGSEAKLFARTLELLGMVAA